MEPKKAFKVFHYNTHLQWTHERRGELTSEGKPTLEVAPPPEFKGPAGVWTPEDLFVAAVDICTMTTFLAFANHKKLPLLSYESSAKGTLENVEGKYQFTQVSLTPRITVASEADVPLAEKIIRDAEASCLISNSIKAQVVLQPEISVAKEQVVS